MWVVGPTKYFFTHQLQFSELGCDNKEYLSFLRGQTFAFNAAMDKLIQVCGAEVLAKEVYKSDGLVWFSSIQNFLEDISAPWTRINLVVAALKLFFSLSSIYTYKSHI